MTEKSPQQLPLSEKERALVRKIAERDGISEDEAATNLIKSALAQRARKRGGSGGRILPYRKR